jgi:hypothetical protein
MDQLDERGTSQEFCPFVIRKAAVNERGEFRLEFNADM